MLLECAFVRSAVISLVLALAAAPLCGDTIRLKNGKVIYADRVREAGGRVEYERGDDTYAIPRSLVERIEAGGLPAPADASAHRSDLPAADLPRLAAEPGAADLVARIVRNGSVDAEAVSALEAQGDARLSAWVNDVAGLHEQERGNLERAGTLFRRGLSFAPENPYLLGHYAALLIKLQRYAEAVPYAERAARRAPDSADALALAGFAYFLADRSRDAVPAWKRSLELRPNDTVRQYLARAERELAAEAGFGQQESSHFVLRYEGKESSPTLRRQLLETLESQFNDLVRQLDVSPRESIPVILYTDQAFFDVTQAPSWADAVNDGKLRIPLQHVETITPELVRILRHELTHSFINQATRGRAPQWLHEGVAQALEPRSMQGRRLARLFAAGQHIPINALEQSFLKFSGPEAAVAYAESLAAVEYIRQTYGMGDLRRILERIGEGASPEAALRATLHSGYAGLEQDLAVWLKKNYGE